MPHWLACLLAAVKVQLLPNLLSAPMIAAETRELYTLTHSVGLGAQYITDTTASPPFAANQRLAKLDNICVQLMRCKSCALQRSQ